MTKSKLIGLFILLFLVGGGITYYIVSNQESTTQVKGQEFTEETISKSKKTSQKGGKSSTYDKTEIFMKMHEMSNTLIIARDGQVWGEVPIDEENIKLVEEMVVSSENLDSREEKQILETLSSWKKGDFSDGVDQHNYFWSKLKGNIGKAKELKSEYKK